MVMGIEECCDFWVELFLRELFGPFGDLAGLLDLRGGPGLGCEFLAYLFELGLLGSWTVKHALGRFCSFQLGLISCGLVLVGHTLGICLSL